MMAAVMADFRYCMHCGAQVPVTARFCPDCGSPSDSEATHVAPSEETRVRTSLPPRPVVPTPRPPAPVEQQRPPEPQRQTPAPTPDTEERVVFTVRPTLVFVKIGYVLAALLGILVVALFSLYLSQYTGAVVFSFVLAVLLLAVPVYYHLRRNLKRYTLTDSKIEIDEGLISQTTRNLPLRNIQDVTVKTTILQRLLGFGDVVIDNASEVGGATVLDNIPDPRRHMDLILRELRRWR